VNIFVAGWTNKEENHETLAAIIQCRNAGKKLVWHQHFYWLSTVSIRYQHSGIRVSPVPLVTD
jgi:hypothetical protein